MIKSSLITAFFLYISGISTIFAQVPYQISGTWTGAEGKKVYLNAFPSGTPESTCIDSAIVASNGTYRLAGNLNEMQPLSITIEGDKGFRTLMGDGRPATVNIKDIKYYYKHPDAAFTIVGDTIEHAAVANILSFWGNDFIRKISMGGLEGEAERAKANGDSENEQAQRIKLQECIDTRDKEKRFSKPIRKLPRCPLLHYHESTERYSYRRDGGILQPYGRKGQKLSERNRTKGKYRQDESFSSGNKSARIHITDCQRRRTFAQKLAGAHCYSRFLGFLVRSLYSRNAYCKRNLCKIQG